MKATRFLLLAVLLLAFVAVLASCDMIAGFLGGDDTTGVTTTATAAVTTATTAVTLPPLASEGGIKSCKLSANGLRLTYESGKSQNLGTVDVREGYNSAKVTDFSLSEGVLTVTLLDSAGQNLALQFLNSAPAAVTLRLREANGYLEWARATGDSWQVLCPARGTASGSNPLTLLATAAEIGKVEPLTATDGMILTVQGNDLRFRATDWLRPGFDMCTDAVLSRANVNLNFMLKAYYEIPSTAAHDYMGTLSTDNVSRFKDASDDLAAIFFNGSYFGGNHGYSLVVKIPNFGKSEKDIGSVWKNNATGQEYCLVKVIDGMLWLCPFDEDSMADGNFNEYSKNAKAALVVGDVLTHVKGATAKNDISVIGDSTLDGNQMQFRSAVNHLEQHIFLNGVNEIALDVDGVYEAEFIDVYETYTVTYLPAVLEHLMRNAGRNDNDSCHDEEIEDAYIRFTKTLRFSRNGSSTLYQENTALKDLSGFYSYGVISGTFNDTTYVYTPASTNFSVPSPHPGGSSITVTGDPLLVRDYYQLADPAATRVMGIGYYPFFGVATDEVRSEMVAPFGGNGMAVGQYSHIRKNYPYLIRKNSLSTGESFSYIGYHTPTVPIDDDFFAINWYFVGDEVMLLLNTDKAVSEKTVALPDYLDGMHVEVTQKSDSFTVASTAVDGGVTVAATGAGYAILRLTPAE